MEVSFAGKIIYKFYKWVIFSMAMLNNQRVSWDMMGISWEFKGYSHSMIYHPRDINGRSSPIESRRKLVQLGSSSPTPRWGPWEKTTAKVFGQKRTSVILDASYLVSSPGLTFIISKLTYYSTWFAFGLANLAWECVKNFDFEGTEERAFQLHGPEGLKGGWNGTAAYTQCRWKKCTSKCLICVTP